MTYILTCSYTLYYSTCGFTSIWFVCTDRYYNHLLNWDYTNMQLIKVADWKWLTRHTMVSPVLIDQMWAILQGKERTSSWELAANESIMKYNYWCSKTAYALQHHCKHNLYIMMMWLKVLLLSNKVKYLLFWWPKWTIYIFQIAKRRMLFEAIFGYPFGSTFFHQLQFHLETHFD